MRHASAMSAGAWMCLALAAGLAWGQNIRRVEPISPGSVGSAAVLVDDVPLVHTAQLLPVDDAGRIVGAGDIRAQLEQVLARLRRLSEDQRQRFFTRRPAQLLSSRSRTKPSPCSKA